MSKTRGNTMDPLDLVEKYGTDALRFALTTGTAPGNDLRFTENRLEPAATTLTRYGTPPASSSASFRREGSSS